METAPTNVAVFKALGDPTRHLISQVLSHQELAVNELAESLQMPQSTVSRHLRVLREAGLVTDRREGVTVYCRVVATHVRRSPQGSSGFCNGGEIGRAHV